MSEIIKSIKRAPYQSFASFLILFFTLFLSLVIFNLVAFFHGILSYVESRPPVVAYFNTNSSETQILGVKKALENSGKIADIKYVNQKQALEIYKRDNQDNPLLLEMVSADILPASLEISAVKPQYLTEIAKFLKSQQIVTDIDFQKDIIDRLLILTSISRKASAAILIYLLIVSIIVVMTTTGFKIALKKEEIDIMQLLGAPKSYIIKPYLYEGIFFGVVSCTAAFSIFTLIFLYFKPIINQYLNSLPQMGLFSFSNYGLYIYPPSINYIFASYFVIIGFGVAIGFFGNLIATQKYIK